MKNIYLKTLLTLLFLTPQISWSNSPWKPYPKASDLPLLERLEEITLRRAGLDPQQIKKWQRGSKWSAALPKIQVGWESKFVNQNTTIIQDSISVTSSGVSVGPESNRVDADFSNNRDFEVKAVWALDELLYNRNQIEVSREARDLELVRRHVIEDLHQTYYQLKSYLLKLELSAANEITMMDQLKIEQLMDKLNSTTGGSFKKMINNNPLKKRPFKNKHS